MKRFFKNLILVVILGVLIYQFRSSLSIQFLPVLNNIKGVFVKEIPCAEPIPYTLDTFDTKFNISQKYFLDALTDAEAIWEKPLGRNLFSYVIPEGNPREVLKVNLIYDYRQQATEKLKSLGIVVKDNRDSYDMLKTKFTALKIKYDQEKVNFSTQIEAFNKKKQVYEDSVSYWNTKGGAPKEEYDKLNAERISLDAKIKVLQDLQNVINKDADEINALVVVLNRLVSTLNLSVEKYNSTTTSVGESFEEGVYISDGTNRQIDIYEFSNREKLVRVLAHELGHALDLDHLEDPKAIMYKYNQSNSQVLSKADIEALKIKCEKK